MEPARSDITDVGRLSGAARPETNADIQDPDSWTYTPFRETTKSPPHRAPRESSQEPSGARARLLSRSPGEERCGDRCALPSSRADRARDSVPQGPRCDPKAPTDQ